MSDYPDTGHHGPIGDLQIVTLVATDGTIDWFCCPRFDDARNGHDPTCQIPPGTRTSSSRSRAGWRPPDGRVNSLRGRGGASRLASRNLKNVVACRR